MKRTFEEIIAAHTKPVVFASTAAAKPATINRARSATETENVIRASPPYTSVFFTDGSCEGNPGPCGAGMVGCLPLCTPKADRMLQVARTVMGTTHDPSLGTYVEQKLALGFGTNNIAELHAIELALDCILQNSCAQPAVRIFTDSLYSIGVLTKNWKATKNVALVHGIKAKWAIVKKKAGGDASIHWCKGHVGIGWNELADRLADATAQRARTMKADEPSILF